MITTNGSINNPSTAKGTCPEARNWIYTQLPIPEATPDGCIAMLRDVEGVGPCPKCLHSGAQIRMASGIPLSLAQKSFHEPLLSPPEPCVACISIREIPAYFKQFMKYWNERIS